MKSLLVFTVVLAVASAQFGNRQRRPLPSFQPLRAAASAVTVTRAAPPPRAAAPPRSSSSDQDAQVVRYDNDINPDGAYNWAYETSNGISAQESGTPRDVGGERPDVAQGSYAYTSPEGVPVSVTYTADENGFQPQSDVLPVAPPIPPQILRALEWIARNPSSESRN